MALSALWNPNLQFLKTDGTINAGGKLVVTDHNDADSIPANYSDADGTTLNSSPIVLDALGRATCYIDDGSTYDLYVKDENGATLWTVPEMTPGAETIVVRAGFSVSSNDSSVAVTISVDADGVTNYDLSIQSEIDRAKLAENAAKTEVAEGDNVNVTESTGANGQKIYTVGVDLSGYKTTQTAVSKTGSATKTVAQITQNANGNIAVTFTDIGFPVKSVTSSDSSVSVTDDGNGNLDLSVSIPSDSQTYGIFTSSDGSTWSKSSGNIDSIGTLDEANYHYTVLVSYSVSTLSNVIDQISLAGGTLTDKRDIDLSYTHIGYVEFSADKKMTAFAPVITMPTGAIINRAYLFIHSIGGTASGSGEDKKVAVDSTATAGYLEDVLVSASDLVTFVKSGNKLLVNVNLDYSSDPKLQTMNESQVDGATSNYGSYALQDGYTAPVWDDSAYTSYQWMNAKVYQCSRLSEAQGTITKCNIALCGSLGFSDPPPCLNIGIFSTAGVLLGQTGLKVYGVDFNSDEELCEFDMTEESDGSLNIDRNTRYIIQVWTCGLQLAGLDRSTNYNYTYDYTLRQNLEGSTSTPEFLDIATLANRASVIPMVSFGAEPLS